MPPLRRIVAQEIIALARQAIGSRHIGVRIRSRQLHLRATRRESGALRLLSRLRRLRDRETRLRIAPSEPRKRLYPEPRVTNFARESAGSRFPCPWFGSKISGSPARSARARVRCTCWVAVAGELASFASGYGAPASLAVFDRGKVGRGLRGRLARAGTPPENRASCPEQHQPSGQNTNSYHGCSQPTAIYVHSFLRCSQISILSIVSRSDRWRFGPNSRQSFFAQILPQLTSLRSVERFGTAHKSIEPRAGEPAPRSLLVTGTGGKIK